MSFAQLCVTNCRIEQVFAPSMTRATVIVDTASGENYGLREMWRETEAGGSSCGCVVRVRPGRCGQEGP